MKAEIKSKATILLVENDSQELSPLTNSIKLSGIETVIARSGKEAISICNWRRIQIIISVIKLQDMTVLELLSSLRNKESSPYFLVIADAKEEGQAIEAIKMGSYDYILRPFAIEKLIRIIDNIRQHIELREELYALQKRMMAGNLISFSQNFANKWRKASSSAKILPLEEAVGEFEKAYLTLIMKRHKLKKMELAKLLGISRKKLWLKLKQYKIQEGE